MSDQNKIEPVQNSEVPLEWDTEAGRKFISELKSPGLAVVLGALFGGLGLLYVTNIKWSITIVIASMILAGITGGVSMLITTLVFGYAGYYLAEQHNEAVKRKYTLKDKLDKGNVHPFTGLGSVNTAVKTDSFVGFTASQGKNCCGTTYGVDSRFCSSCGKELKMDLPETCCGSPLKPEANFCSHCGKPRAAKAA